MAIHGNKRDLTIESVSECLDAADLLIKHRKVDNGMMGYAAVLLLFSVIDAIGHHLDVGTGHTRLVALNSFQLEPRLEPQQICDITKWYRNSLVHNASIVPGVVLSPDDTGEVFEFVIAKPVMIRVPQLYELVRKAWTELDKADFNPLRHTITVPPPPLTAGPYALTVSGVASVPSDTSAFSMPASGMVTLPPDNEI